jgi:hypothetical protein
MAWGESLHADVAVHTHRPPVRLNSKRPTELVQILTEIVHATRARLSEARPGDGLKAAEMLAKMCGWNEPERVNVQNVEVKVDAALIEQLRAGYAQLGARQACLPVLEGQAQPLDGAPLALAEGAGAGWPPPRRRATPL